MSANTSADTELVKQTDKEMSDLAQKDGFFTALKTYASEDMVKFDEGSVPVLGKANYEKTTEGKPGPTTLSWNPEHGEVSGDLGYTWGKWTYTLPDTVIHGVYVTIWKRQSDGSWKWVLDGGNSTPKF